MHVPLVPSLFLAVAINERLGLQSEGQEFKFFKYIYLFEKRGTKESFCSGKVKPKKLKS